MISLDSITNENNKEHNEKQPYIPDHSFRILIIGGSGSRITNAKLHLMNEQDDIDKIYLYAKDLSKPKYEFLIKKCENAGIKHLDDPNAFTECCNTMDDDCVKIYKECTRDLYCFLTTDKTLSASNPFRFRKNLLIPL